MWKSEKTYKRRVCDAWNVLAGKKPMARNAMIMSMYPSINSHLVWRKLSQVIVTNAARSMRYLVIYDLVPTNVRLYSIHLVATESCSQCGTMDALMHTLRNVETTRTFGYTTAPFQHIFHRTTPRRIPREWFLCSAFRIWQHLKHQAKLCFFAYMVFCGKIILISISTLGGLHARHAVTRLLVLNTADDLWELHRHLLSYD